MGADPKLKEKIRRILQDELKDDAWIDISDGYADHVHIIVVSTKFDEMEESDKQDYLWAILDKSETLTDEEKTKISLILPYGRVDLK